MGRVAVAVVLAWLAFGALGGGAWARDAFDDDYSDCPSHSRVDAFDNLRVVRGEEADELDVSWDEIDPLALGLGEGRYKAEIVVIADGTDNIVRRAALGENEVTFDGITQASDWEISIALTDRKYVLSHIVTAKFTAGLDKPKLFDSFYYVPTASALDDDKYLKDSSRELQLKRALDDEKIKKHDKGTFYYLGFNHNFDNYYVDTGMTNPADPKFRIGLVHDLDIDPGDADFDHFRLEIRDSTGDDVLGFQASTVSDSGTYGADTVIVFGSVGTGRAAQTQYNMAAVDKGVYDSEKRFSNVKTANTIDADEGGRLDAVYNSSDSFWRQYFNAAGTENDQGPQVFAQKPRIWEGGTTLELSLPSATPVQIPLYLPATDATQYTDVSHYSYSLNVTAGTEIGRNLSYANLMPAYMLGANGNSSGIQASIYEASDSDTLLQYFGNGGIRRLFARTPDEYYDVSSSALSDDGSYTITVWAENDDDDVISPTATLTFNLQNAKDNGTFASNLFCVDASNNTNLYFPRPLLLRQSQVDAAAAMSATLRVAALLREINPLASRLCTHTVSGALNQVRAIISADPPGLPAAGSSKTSSPINYDGRVVGMTIEAK